MHCAYPCYAKCMHTIYLTRNACILYTLWYFLLYHGSWINNEINAGSMTHWGRLTPICVGNLTIIGSDNGLSPGRRHAVIWTNGGISLIGPTIEKKFREIIFGIHAFSNKKMHLKMSSGKWRTSCLGLSVLRVFIKCTQISTGESACSWNILNIWSIHTGAVFVTYPRCWGQMNPVKIDIWPLDHGTYRAIHLWIQCCHDVCQIRMCVVLIVIYK